MTSEVRIAHHYLGERLRRVAPAIHPRSHWAVMVGTNGAHEFSMIAPTVAEAAAACAARLRSSEWAPSHARLEWTRATTDAYLWLLVGTQKVCLIRFFLSEPEKHMAVAWTPLSFDSAPLPDADMLTTFSEWCAKNLPYHLPPFPETPDAT